MPRVRRASDQGFTLVELAWTMVVFGLLATVGVFGFRALANSLAENGTQRDVVSLLRNVQTRAVTEANTYCVQFGPFDAQSRAVKAAVYRTPGMDSGPIPAGFSCQASGTQVQTYTAQSGTYVANVDFTQRDGSHTAWVLFYPRGSASPGGLDIIRGTSSKQYHINVDGLTARVSSDGY